ncbi:MAG: PAS domain-containing protein, partial [bacterium]|nr:PAS domain-containing protein [bacterium]
SPVIMFLWKNDEGWPVEFVSENVKEIFGYTAREFTSGSIAYEKVVHPEDLERVANEVDRHGKDNRIQNFINVPYRVITKSGEVRWIDNRTHIRRDKEGKITHYQGIVIDITENELAKEALRESEEKFREISEQSIVGISILQDGKWKYMNDRLSEIIGYTHQEVLEWDPSEFAKLVHPEDRSFVTEQAKKKQKGETDVTVHYNYRTVSKSGEIKWIENYSCTINYQDKPADLVIINDITERKRTEELLRIQKDLGIALGSVNRLDEGLRLCFEAALEVSGMDCGAIYLVDPDTGSLDCKYHQGLSPEFV